MSKVKSKAKKVKPMSKTKASAVAKAKIRDAPRSQTMDSTNLSPEDLLIMLDSEIDDKTLVGHHIDSFNRFTSIGINQIVTKLFKVEKTIVNERTNTPEDNEIETIQYEVKFNRVEIGRPTTQF